MKKFAALLIGLVGICIGAAAQEGPYPNRPIRLVVPFTAGGGVDLMARVMSTELSKRLGQQIVVDNVTGAGGTIGSAAMARAKPDGYTLIMHSVSSAAVNAVALTTLTYDPVASFVPVSLIGRTPFIVVLNSTVPASTVKEFAALTNAEPAKHSYGSSGVGTSVYLASELLRHKTGMKIQHVPYRGTAAASLDLLAGNMSMLIDGPTTQLQNIGTAKVKAIAVTTAKRSPLLPNIPGMLESGVEDMDVWFWTAVFAPAGTPETVVRRLAQAIGESMKQPAVTGRFTELGTESNGSSPQELNAYWRAEMASYSRLIKSAGLKLDAE